MPLKQKQSPKIFWSHSNHLSEQDCACPVDAGHAFGGNLFINNPNFGDNSNWQISPDIYRLPLPESHCLLFNPLGPIGPVVVNQSAQTILDAYTCPLPLLEGIEKIQEIPIHQALLTVQQLTILGLIVSPTQVRWAPKRLNTLTAWLHITNDCNLHCDYCYVSKTPDKMEIDHGKQAVDTVVQSAVSNGFHSVKLKYAGGESTLNFPLILILHDYAQSIASKNNLGFSGVVLSNGVGISNSMIDALQERKLRLSISLDGIGKYQDGQRKFINGRGSFNLVERTLDRLASRKIKPSITITLSSRNLEGLPHVIEYVLERELPFTINFYRENDCSISFSDLSYNDEQIINAMKKAFVIIENNLPPFDLLGALTDRARLDIPHDRPCGVGHSYIVIDQNGKIAKCHMEIEDSVTDILANDPLKLIQTDKIGIQNLSVDKKEDCRECTWRYSCAGGCPALTYRVTGRYDVKSPNCRVYKVLFPEVLRLEGLRLMKNSEPLAFETQTSRGVKL